jgi:hypothetical protein
MSHPGSSSSSCLVGSVDNAPRRRRPSPAGRCRVDTSPEAPPGVVDVKSPVAGFPVRWFLRERSNGKSSGADFVRFFWGASCGVWHGFLRGGQARGGKLRLPRLSPFLTSVDGTPLGDRTANTRAGEPVPPGGSKVAKVTMIDCPPSERDEFRKGRCHAQDLGCSVL